MIVNQGPSYLISKQSAQTVDILLDLPLLQIKYFHTYVLL